MNGELRYLLLYRSFSSVKLIRHAFESTLTDENIGRLMRITIEGSELTTVGLNAVVDIFKAGSNLIVMCIIYM